MRSSWNVTDAAAQRLCLHYYLCCLHLCSNWKPWPHPGCWVLSTTVVPQNVISREMSHQTGRAAALHICRLPDVAFLLPWPPARFVHVASLVPFIWALLDTDLSCHPPAIDCLTFTSRVTSQPRAYPGLHFTFLEVLPQIYHYCSKFSGEKF